MNDKEKTEITIFHFYRPWYVRAWRWCTRWKSDGSRVRPHMTLRRAIKDVPYYIGPNTRYVIELLGDKCEVIRK